MDSSLTQKIKDSLRLSWKEGIPAAIMQGIMDYYLIPFALVLKASELEIGLLVAIPNIVASISQLTAVQVVSRSGSRLRFLVWASAAQAVLLTPLIVLTFTGQRWAIWALVGLAVVFRILASLIATVWGSLVSDYLPANKRGHYFGWRSQVTGFAGVGGIALAGLILFLLKQNVSAGFMIIFVLNASCRFVSAFLMAKMTDLPLEVKKESHFTFLMFLKRFKESNFVKFVLFVSAITFTTNLSAPYFSVWLLRDLKFNYIAFMCVHMAAVVAMLISFPIWGRHADVVGNAKILKTTSLLIPLVPLSWLISGNFFYLVAVELFAGFVWGGFNLCATNFIYDAVVPDKRVRCLSYFNLINGLALSLGALLGGFLAERLPPILGSTVLSLALLSGVTRVFAHCIFSDNFKEVRSQTQSISSLKLFYSVLGVSPVVGRANDFDISSSINDV